MITLKTEGGPTVCTSKEPAPSSPVDSSPVKPWEHTDCGDQAVQEMGDCPNRGGMSPVGISPAKDVQILIPTVSHAPAEKQLNFFH